MRGATTKEEWISKHLQGTKAKKVFPTLLEDGREVESCKSMTVGAWK
jgi:hypothetical protein